MKESADTRSYRRNPVYLAEKKRFVDAMLDAGERALGPFRNRITHVELATPLTQARYTLSTGGTPFGLAQWGPARSRPDTTTGVRGLYVVGQSTRYGSGIAGVMVSGITCAGQILERPLMAEVHRGVEVGCRAALPRRESMWDPVAVSRGRGHPASRNVSR